jgi:hypothetical protein
VIFSLFGKIAKTVCITRRFKMYAKEFCPDVAQAITLIDCLRCSSSWNLVIGGSKLAKKTAKHSDAVMTGILVTRFKMGQINTEELEQMAADGSREERCSAAKKVLEAIRDAPDLPSRHDSLSSMKVEHQKMGIEKLEEA